jgi:signal transduction histidine kinase
MLCVRTSAPFVEEFISGRGPEQMTYIIQHQSGEIEKPAIKFNLSAFLDYFIPPEVQVQPDAHRRARMFMLSHAFGPLLGNVIPLYLHFIVKIEMDYRFWIFLISVMVFWMYPFALRVTKQYQILAFISVQNLIFCILWACYSYGGIYSPFLSWALIIPLLAFFYLPATGIIRNILLIQIFGSVGLFGALVVGGFAFPAVDLSQFQLIGIISTLSASIYVVMMALYFANVFREQGEFQRELGSLMATADNMINLTAAAQQATTAKADFITSMSHELRTPLNAVIGYSQLLLEDIDEKADAVFARDVERIHGAGNYLLRLVDDVLDFSKLEAGKMLSHASAGSLSEMVGKIASDITEHVTSNTYTLECDIEPSNAPLNADWQTLKKAIHHLISGIVADGAGGAVRIQARENQGNIAVRITDPKIRDDEAQSVSLFDVFSNDSDASATKYGSVGIAFALSLKFAHFVGGEIIVEKDIEGRRVFALTIPVNAAGDAAQASA